ncbi:MAG: pyroglutamyl-peptidase I [Janthinobacterium lividum]
MHKIVLIAGFEPFGGETINPAWEAVKDMNGLEVMPGYHVVTAMLPCVFDRVRHVLMDAIRAVQPDVVIAVGQAGGRSDISLERIAINVDDARIPDNLGQQPIDRPVDETGPAAYFSTLPIKAMMLALREEGIPASISNSAGTFVCNHVFYSLMHSLRGRPDVRAGFIHIPYLPQQAARFPSAPSMSGVQVTAALLIAIRSAATTEFDLPVQGGALH